MRADARGAQWTKLLFNACTNPLCALTGLTHGELCDFPPTIDLVDELIREGRAVADALGIELEDDPAELVYSAAKANYATARACSRTSPPIVAPRSRHSTAASSAQATTSGVEVPLAPRDGRPDQRPRATAGAWEPRCTEHFA